MTRFLALAALLLLAACAPMRGPRNDPNHVADDRESQCHMNSLWRTGL